MRKSIAIMLIIVAIINIFFSIAEEAPAYADGFGDAYRGSFIYNQKKFGLPTFEYDPDYYSFYSEDVGIYVMIMTGEEAGTQEASVVFTCTALENADMEYFFLTCACLIHCFAGDEKENELYGRMLSLYIECKTSEQRQARDKYVRSGMRMGIKVDENGYLTFVGTK